MTTAGGQDKNNSPVGPLGSGNDGNSIATSNGITEEHQSSPGRLLADGSDRRSMREKFNVNTTTGGVSFSIPIQTSPGRSGFGPSLNLMHESGAASANGVFGLGWHLGGVESIARKTSESIPVYDDDKDTFIHSRIGDLVPVLLENGTGFAEVERDGYRVRIYQPRVESDPVRIERWTSMKVSDDIYWKVITSGNVTSIFGRTDSSRICSCDTSRPGGRKSLFSWLACETYDSHGNHMVYSYKAENDSGINFSRDISEAQRHPTFPCSQRYLKSIKYGNTKPNRDMQTWEVLPSASRDDRAHWMFEAIFDYGEHDSTAPTTKEDGSWNIRPDPFSVHTSGFELRTYRRCQRVLMFHHFPQDLGRLDCLVASTTFQYEMDTKSETTLLKSCTPWGHSLRPNGEYFNLSLAPTEFEYSAAPDLGDVQVEDFDLSLSGLSTPGAQWIDLNGDGAPGVLIQVPGGGWYYHRNQSDDGQPDVGGATLVPRVPSAVSSAQWNFEDFRGDGLLDVVFVSPDGHIRGFYGRTEDGEWTNFVPFKSYPAMYSFEDPKIQKIDLNGNGHADLLRMMLHEDDEFTWHPSLGHQGYGEERRTIGAPALPAGDLERSVLLCDMDGDGLSDIVVIYNGHVCYWPNMGHGQFGPKVVMDNPPHLADGTNFSPLRIRMADVTGSGTADLIYLPPEGGARVYYNRSGNRWSDENSLHKLPQLDHSYSVDVFDISGRGTQCLCWTSDLHSHGGDAGSTKVRFIDLMGRQKPGLVTKCSNGIGGETSVAYRSSTRYHLDDERAGRPWMARLPFPIHCVASTTTTDLVAQTSCTTRYAYHNGYYDPVERQFRGFQMVEEWDAENFAPAATREFQRPPVHTKSWFYIGLPRLDENADLPGSLQVDQPQQGPLPSAKFRQKIVPECLTAGEVQDAYRALTGQQRRQEIFGDDGSTLSTVPYLVSQQTYDVVMHQGTCLGYKHGIFRVNRREEVTSHYERVLSEARVQHSLVLQTDAYGNVEREAVINYGKPVSELPKAEDREKQTETVIIYTEKDYTNAIDSPDLPNYFQSPLQSEVRQYRVFPGPSEATGAPNRYSWETVAAKDCAFFTQAEDIPVHQSAADIIQSNQGQGYKALISKTRTLYSTADLSGPLPVHELEPFSVEYQSYQLAVTTELLQVILKNSEAPLLDQDTLSEELRAGGYVKLEDGSSEWWSPSTRKLFGDDKSDGQRAAARSQFYIPNGEIDQYRNVSHLDLDPYQLLPVKLVDAVGNTTSFVNDYTCLQPTEVTDANGNRTQAAFDPCGRSVGIAVMGKATEDVGDSLKGFSADLSKEQLKDFTDNPSGLIAAQLLGRAGRRSIYNDHYEREPKQIPAFHAELVRDTHHKNSEGIDLSPQISVHITYLDGSGQAIQNVSLSGNSGENEKWQFSGWVIHDNKEQPVKQFLPFTALTHDFRPQADSSSAPATTLLRDPLDRVVGVLNADHSWSKTRFTPWTEVTFDAGDTIRIEDPAQDHDVGGCFQMLDRNSYHPTWYGIKSHSTKEEQQAASKSAAYHDTPTTIHMDPLGREIVTELDNGPLGECRDKSLTRKEYNIRGNVAELRDALDRVVTVTWYDLLGRPLHSINLDSGSRWHLSDCRGSPFLSCSSRGDRQRISYDKLQRIETIKVRLSHPSSEVVAVKNVYGEGQPDALQKNLKGQLYQCYDQSGLQTNHCFDFHGNCLESSVRYAIEYKHILDWSKEDTRLEEIEYENKASFNAIGQNVHTEDFSGESVWRAYDVAGRLKTLKSLTADEKIVTSSVNDIEYSEDNKITSIGYGNGSRITHEYDAATRRLVNTCIKRTKDGTSLQDLSYTYDCLGRVIQKADRAQQTVYFHNSVVLPSQEFRYDPLGQLLEATGREQVDVSNAGQKRLRPYDAASGQRSSVPGDGHQVIEYIEMYEYDRAGNIRKTQHAPRTAKEYSGWTRTYSYQEPSCVDPNVDNNRLSETKIGHRTETYRYDDDAGRNGCMTSIPGYSILAWDHNDRLRSFSTQTVAEGAVPETTWYIYNAQGERVRKVTERGTSIGDASTPTRSKETRYLPLQDLCTTYRGDGLSISREIKTASVGDLTVARTPIALLEYDSSTQQRLVRYQTSDNLELDSSSQVVSYGEYSPYGASTYHSQNKGIPRMYRFASYQRDCESGLYACGERYYAPWLGRWTSADPWGTVDGLNLYAYVRNDPVNIEDPRGTMSGTTQSQQKQHPKGKKSQQEKHSKGTRSQKKQPSEGERSQQNQPQKKESPTAPQPGDDFIVLYRGTTPDRAQGFAMASQIEHKIEHIETRSSGDFNYVPYGTAYFSTSESRAREHAGAGGTVMKFKVPQWIYDEALSRDSLQYYSKDSREYFQRIIADRLQITPETLRMIGKIERILPKWLVDHIIKSRVKDITIGPELGIPTRDVTQILGQNSDQLHKEQWAVQGQALRDIVQYSTVTYHPI